MALSTNRTLITQTGINTHQVLNVGGLDSAGIATFSNFKTGSTNIHSVGVEAAGINVLGGDTPIGAGSTIFDDGGARFVGVVTASGFSGDGSSLTGVASTDNIKTSTTANFTGGIQVGGSTTLTGALSATTATANLVVVGSAVTANSQGIDVTGIVTATTIKVGTAISITDSAVSATRFHGDGSQLTGISAGTALSGSTNNTVCTVTGSNAIQGEANLTFNGSALRVVANDGGADVNFAVRNTNASGYGAYISGGGTGSGQYILRLDNKDQSEKVRFPSTGGISFNGDTAAANALDDYEEGSWTPACNVGSVSVADGGTYVKIGKLVHLTVLLYNFSNTSSGSSILISGVPFNSSAQAVGTTWLRRTNIESLAYKCTIGDSANNIINIMYDSNGNGNNMGGALTYAKFAHSTPYMNITLTYQTNS